MDELLSRWAGPEVTSRRERNLAIRIAAQRAQQEPAGADEQLEAHEAASVPGVLDFFTRRRRVPREVVPDDLDVFERYYAEHPDGVLEVFDE